MAAVLLQYMVPKQEFDIQFDQAGVLLDNTPKVSWLKCMANKAQSHTPGRLLRGLEAIKRVSQVGPLSIASASIVKNSMTDVASGSFSNNYFLFFYQFLFTTATIL